MHEMTWMDPKGIVTSPQRALYDSILQYVLIGTVIEMEKLVISGSMRGWRKGVIAVAFGQKVFVEVATQIYMWWKDTHTLYGVSFLPVIFFHNYQRCNHGWGRN